METFNETNESYIVVCYICEGKGTIDERISTYDSESIKCPTCLGKGLLYKHITIKYSLVG